MAPSITPAGGSRWLLALAGVLPVLLMASALRTYFALEAQGEVYLRSRASAVAAQMELLAVREPEAVWRERLADGEESLLSVTLPERGARAELAPLWNGEELFRTARVTVGGVAVYRAWVPFHAGEELRVAQIDLRADAADFLTGHARHHLWLVMAGSALMVALAVAAERARRRAAAAERRQMEMAHLAHLGELSAVLAHEIRNPLGTIKGYAQLLEEKASCTEAALVRPIVSETRRLEELVRDLLRYGRPAEPRWRPVAAGDLARTLRDHAQALAGVEARVEIGEFQIESDPDLIEQILLNLMRNGADAARGRTPATIAVEGRLIGEEAVLTVTDSGAGFSREALARLFEPFFTTKAAGTGLGLAISRKLAGTLGGSLTAANAPEGGARLTLRLPAKRRSS